MIVIEVISMGNLVEGESRMLGVTDWQVFCRLKDVAGTLSIVI
jgi:hypothetical protein